jgi:hypothetical protein
VAQRFPAAITGLFSESALAAAVELRRGKYFFRKLLDEKMRTVVKLGLEWCTSDTFMN